MSAHTPLCIGCNKRPSEIEEYIDAVEEERDYYTRPSIDDSGEAAFWCFVAVAILSVLAGIHWVFN